MTAQQLKAEITRKQREARTLTAASSREGRSLSESDMAKLRKLVAEVDDLKTQLEAMAAGDEDDEEEVETKSRRRSSHMSMDGGPAIHTREPERYSLLRAMQRNLEGRRLDGLEGEVEQELRNISPERKVEGFLMPFGNEPQLRGLLKHSYRQDRRETRGDLTTSTGTGAVFVSPMLPFIEVLRNRLVCQKMGATFLSGMEGKFSIPRQTSAAQSAWIAEGDSLTPNNQALDQVPFVNKTLGAAVNISRKFIYQSSLDAEQFVQNDIAKVLAIAFDYAAINGSGSGATPTGILQNTAIQTLNTAGGLTSGTNGGAPTWANIVKLESLVAGSNADTDQATLGYLTSPLGRGKLKTTLKVGTEHAVFLWDDSAERGVGEVNGNLAYSSNQVPSNLTKASGSALTALIYGDWSSLILASWGGVDVVVNPFSAQLSGQVTISMLMEADVNIRHPESFRFLADIATT